VEIDVEREERYWYPDDGGIVWLAGFQPIDEQGRFLANSSDELRERGIRITHAAGAQDHYGPALNAAVSEPGNPIHLHREPENPYDPNAIKLLNDDGDQVGYVPRDVASEVAAEIDEGKTWSAVVLRERRASPRDPRTGLTVLLARADSIELRPRHF
jgi:hypothetical protein